MNNENTGGPAFPYGTAYAGMTLRDYFAAKALQGLLVNETMPHRNDVMRKAYKIADAMLKARE